MSGKVNTNTLMKRLFKAADLDTYFQKNEYQMEAPDFYTLLKSLCEQRETDRTDLRASTVQRHAASFPG